ncbi:MAG: hypothetical protein M9931_00095 [Chitinophagales bacterium]|nr:hypothetical protein [Chitinophagales bacterium]
MNKKFLFLLIGSLVWVADIFSQVYDADALKYSYRQTGGTARSMGVAGAFGSVGADLSSTLQNPAGIALFRASEMSLGVGIHVSSTNSSFLEQQRSGDKTNFSFNYGGFVVAGAIKQKGKVSFSSSNLKFVNFALTYNRISNFNRTVNYDGFNKHNVYADSWLKELNGLNGTVPDYSNASTAAVLAYNNQSVFFDSVSNQYITYMRPPLAQSGSIKESGALDEVNLALGFNINEKVFFAFDAGIPFLSYSAVNEFREKDAADSIVYFDNYTFNQQYRSSGVGFNAKFGLIVRPVAWYRGGIAFQTPTWFRLDENYYASFTENYNSQVYSKDADFAPFRYNLTQPMQGTVSNSFYFKQYGFISVDYEFQNYGAIKHKFPNYDAMSNSINTISKNKYGFAHTVRVGVEGSVNWFRIRAGYAWQSTPFKIGVGAAGYNEQRNTIAFGLGYRGKKFFADLGYQLLMYNTYSQPYQSNDGFEPAVRTKNQLHNILLTVGWRFTKA